MTNGTLYKYEFAALNDAGVEGLNCGLNEDGTIFKLEDTAPIDNIPIEGIHKYIRVTPIGLPRIQTITATPGNQSITFNLTTDPVGSTITNYKVYDSADNLLQTITTSSTTPSITITQTKISGTLQNLLNGTSYTFKFSGSAIAGEGNKSTKTAVPSTVPTISSLSAIQGDYSRQVKITFTANSQGMAINNYKIYTDAGLTNLLKTFTENSTALTINKTLILDNLNFGTYTFYIVVNNNNGNSITYSSAPLTLFQKFSNVYLRTTGLDDSNSNTTQGWYDDVGTYIVTSSAGGKTLKNLYDGDQTTFWNPYRLRPTRPNTKSADIEKYYKEGTGHVKFNTQAGERYNTDIMYYVFKIVFIKSYILNSFKLVSYDFTKRKNICSIGWDLNNTLDNIRSGSYYKLSSGSDINRVTINNGDYISIQQESNNIKRDTIYIVIETAVSETMDAYVREGFSFVLQDSQNLYYQPFIRELDFQVTE